MKTAGVCLFVWAPGGLDVLLWLVCFFITVIFGAMEGILASIVLSLLWLLRKTARPQCCVLGRLPQTHIYRNVARFPMAREEPGKKCSVEMSRWGKCSFIFFSLVSFLFLEHES